MRFAAGLTRFKLDGPVAAFMDFSWKNQTLEHELVNVSVQFFLSQTRPMALNRLATFSAHIVENGHILSRKVELAPVRPPRVVPDYLVRPSTSVGHGYDLPSL